MNSIDLPPAVSMARLPETYTRAKLALQACVSIDECKDWADKAEAMASYARQSGDVELRRMAVHREANGRDLEGAINRLLAHDKLTGQPVTLEMAEREMRDLIRPAEPKRVRIEDIQQVVARQYGVSRADLLSPRRTMNVVRPRHVAMYLAKILTLRSLPEIGRRFGGRDHTTVLHAVRKIDAVIGNDPALAEEIEVLKRRLQD